jgi:glycosyltransferase involved in cell wall biosynthesis
MGPFGVIGAITPCTNPSETVLCNTIGMLAGGNTVVFNPHPAAVKTSIYAINLLNEASLEAGGPDNLYVAPDDAQAMAAAIRQSLRGAEGREERIRRSREYIRRFEGSDVARQMVAIYRRLLS